MRKLRRYGPPLALIAPSVFLIGVFVYGLIIASFQTSMTDAHTSAQFTGVQETHFVGLQNYIDILKTDNFQHSLRNLLLYTVVFLSGTMFFGFLWAFLLDKRARAEGFIRSVYLFPMAVSSIAAGVVWKWLLNANTGARASGLNRLFQLIGLDFLQNKWWSNYNWGIAAIAIPAIWQMSGYVMALFLAGFRGIPNELREAARVDGANEWQLYRHVIFPQLSPVALSAIIIIGHMSLKGFDLIVAIAKPASYETRVPAIDMYQFQTEGNYANASTVGIILLLVVLVLIVPYLVHTARAEKNR
ncbi:MAG: sugar ABC transporter permease [Bifidobacteriaceae bacterium]|jgi:glucose/mannose transport system permease protein|nr:sugar ABC transporter permease [Bifidobacteriaceae bacterium]